LANEDEDYQLEKCPEKRIIGEKSKKAIKRTRSKGLIRLHKRPDLTIVTLTWNSKNHILSCVERTLQDAADAGLDCEFFIVDNGSNDGTCEILKQLQLRHSQIRIWFLSENRGTTASRNIALRHGSGRFFCVLDSDAYPERGCLRRLVRVLETDLSVGIAVPRIVFPDGRCQKSVDEFPTIWGKFFRTLFLRRIESQEASPQRGPVPYAISAFWLLGQKVFQEVGLLDERIFYAPEDADFCLSTWKKGFSIFYEPEAVAIHDAQEKSRRLMPNALTFMHIKGLVYFFWKHRYVFRKPFTIVP
jgi:GT2 family glycosyltransferase